MKLAQLSETTSYTYYVDMDGVLADLETAIRKRKVYGNWRDKANLLQAVGNPADSRRVMQFYSEVPKTREADVIWAAAVVAGGGPPTVLTSVHSDIPSYTAAKRKWVDKYLSPRPRNFIAVTNNRKQGVIKSKCDVLIDDTPSVIEAFRAAGGIGILHRRNEVANTVARIKNPALV